MKLITLRSQIEEVAQRWGRQYPPQIERDAEKLEIGRRLREIDTATATPELVAKIIGNTSWVRPYKCNECERTFVEVVEVGEAPDYESATAILCRGCVTKALSLFASPPPGQSK